ncbi:YHYH protein [Methylogaea oryzae]|uniref:YHYH domain-containing protein n=1 Tax=Methylogaea oryzae TaxID=1295382 RepID=A0A8D4VNV6_9GAMM|nr:YHYH protein [Methylogaea oryzae]BBL70957.1 hypothetical protein MoryE10_15630 [Methylogaea oryzae]
MKRYWLWLALLACKPCAADSPLPLGDGKIASEPRVGYVYSCRTRFEAGGGAFRSGPWLSGQNWRPELKIAVSGEVDWPEARVDIRLSGGERIISGNGLPLHASGEFPVRRDDAAFDYDRNPNAIAPLRVELRLPALPRPTDSPACLGMGMIGIASSGAAIFNALDAMGRDAPAYEIQDRCDGHPERRGRYHYHTASRCIGDSAQDRHSDLAGYALDGFGIYGRRGENGQPLSNADLDVCHGHTHAILWDGVPVRLYHYHLTAEFPYSLGCYRGTPVATGEGPPEPGWPPPRRHRPPPW